MGRGHTKDITGLRSGHVTALEPTKETRKGSVLWHCRCDCGKEFLVESYKITRGRIKSCGCLRHETRRKNIEGQRFGKLTAIRRLEEKRGSNYLWLCQCDCGNDLKVTANALLSGNTKSCGCRRVDAIRQTVQQRGTVADHIHFVEGTCVERLERKGLQSNNTSGYTGVQARGRKWVAVITFKGKVYYLGTYAAIEEAAQARKQAEQQLFGPFLEWYYAQHGRHTMAGCAKTEEP